MTRPASEPEIRGILRRESVALAVASRLESVLAAQTAEKKNGEGAHAQTWSLSHCHQLVVACPANERRARDARTLGRGIYCGKLKVIELE